MDFPVICECKAHDKAIVMTDLVEVYRQIIYRKTKK